MPLKTIREFTIDDVLVVRAQLHIEYRYATTWDNDYPQLFSANLVHTTLCLFRRIGIKRMRPYTRIRDTDCTMNDFSYVVSQLLQLYGYNEYSSIFNPTRIYTPYRFKTSLSTYIQECCPDYKQYHIYYDTIVSTMRDSITNKLYRPNLFASPSSWNYQVAQGFKSNSKCPPCIKYFRASNDNHKTITQ